MTDEEALAFARRLIDAGVPVFAAPPGGPIGYRLPAEWQKVRPDPKRLDVWRPGHALAAVCGHGLDVLDIDPRNGGDVAERELMAAGAWPTTYAIVTTPSGGRHYYVASLGVAKAARDGIDLQAGAPDGSGRGFVFLPGTERVSKTTGEIAPYALVVDRLDAFGQDDHSGAALLEWVSAGKPATSRTAEGVAGAAGQPIRENHDNTLAAYAASRAARGDTFEEIVTLVLARGRDCVPSWESGMRPGDETLEEAARNRWVPSALRKYGREWVDVEAQPWPAFDEAVAQLEQSGPTGAGAPAGADERVVAVHKEAERLRVAAEARALVEAERSTSLSEGSLAERMVSGGAFVLDIPEGIPAVWGDGDAVLWAKGEALIIAGPPGVGKTTLAHQVVEATITGGEVLGYPVAPDGRLLYLACDRPAQIARALARRLSRYPRELLDARIVVWKGPPPGDFARDPNLLTRLCQAAGATRVVVDSLKDVAVGLSEDAVGAGLNLSRQTALAAGIDVLELHHVVKRGENGSAPTRLADLYGSAWIPAGAGSVVLVWGEAGDTEVRVSHLKQPGATVGPLSVVHDHETGTSRVALALRVESLAGLFVGGMTAKAAAERLYGSTAAPDVERARRKCVAAVAAGELVVGAAGGKGAGNTTVWFPRCPSFVGFGRCSMESKHGGDCTAAA